MHEAGWHSLGPLAGFPEGMQVREVAGEMVLVLRRGDTILASQSLCPHKFGNLAEGILAGFEIECPMHDATFDLRTGRPRIGQEWAGLLPIYDTRIRDGDLQIRLDPA